MPTTVWILEDQLSPENSALGAADKADTVVLFIESKAHGEAVRWHQQKLVLMFSAMRHFAAHLEANGWRVDYYRFETTPDFLTGLIPHLEKHHPDEIRLAAPNDRVMASALPKFERRLGIPIRALPTRQFLVERDDFSAWAADRKRLVMEDHYRRQRRRTGWLMTATGPTGGVWNYDPLNRQTFKQYAASPRPPESAPLREEPDTVTRDVIAGVEREFAGHPGRARDFWFPVTRAGALQWLERFVAERLENFGPFEDLSVQGQPILYHSVLSPLLNLGLLTPTECIERVLAAFAAGRAPIHSVEGFVRQVVGWREFINGVYWHRGPEYGESNFFAAQRPLPAWFYTGETEMNCLRQSITQALALGWIHHIQRLMIVGNFLLLAGIAPQAALRWYLEMTVDAYDWVMLPNVLGLVLHADGGYLATKPYAAGGGYIHKMSNYCEGCRYSPLKKTGPDACPFNSLYWDFYARHADTLRHNPRVSRVVSAWENRGSSDQQSVRQSAARFLEGR